MAGNILGSGKSHFRYIGTNLGLFGISSKDARFLWFFIFISLLEETLSWDIVLKFTKILGNYYEIISS